MIEVALILVSVTLLLALRDARGQVDIERGRVNDLLSRLAARTHGEYAAFAVTAPEPEDDGLDYAYDPTGLVEVRVERADRG